MTDQENKVDKFDERVSSLERQVATVATKVDMLVIEAQQQREDIRRVQEKHDAEMQAMNKKIDDKFDKLSEQLHTMTLAAVVGFGAIAAAVGGLVFTAFK
ncbi:MAG: hypothetical protein IKZ53_05810 [Selenomonadaceae bacterium]|nr:hypothetical protein [Selenomonadaceae bacterium]